MRGGRIRKIWCKTCRLFTVHSINPTKRTANGVWFLSLCLKHNNIKGLSLGEIKLAIDSNVIDVEHNFVKTRDWKALKENQYL